jgi:hypothetical protein
MSIEAELSRILSLLDLPSTWREVLLERFAGSVELAKAGEEGVALENLCDNLFEFEVRLPNDIRDHLAELCRRWGVGSHRIRLLDALAAPPKGT